MMEQRYAEPGDLSIPRLLAQYANGWYVVDREDRQQDPPVFRWYKSATFIRLAPELIHSQLHSRSYRSSLRKVGHLSITMDRAFDEVLELCAVARTEAQPFTWITPRLREMFRQLRSASVAWSVEGWRNDELVAGFFGVALGRSLVCHSTFHSGSGAGTVCLRQALPVLYDRGIRLLDFQAPSPISEGLHAETLPRTDFLDLCRAAAAPTGPDASDYSRPGPTQASDGQDE